MQRKLLILLMSLTLVMVFSISSFAANLNDEVVNQSVDMLREEVRQHQMQENVRLELANITKNSYLVVFDANGGEGQMNSEVFLKDVEKPLLKNTYTKDGYKFKGWSTTVDGEVEFEDVASVKNLTKPLGETTLYAVWKSNGALAAVEWARKIANDDSFSYGTGQRAHRSGCYFCGTNTGPNKYKKEKKGEPHEVDGGHTYEKTYCCNPFATAAYAHGTEAPAVLSVCSRGSCLGMKPSEWTGTGCFKLLGACSEVPFEDIELGDVVMSDKSVNGWHHHVWLVGDPALDEIIEAGGGWGASSISSHKGLEKRYKSYADHKGCYVVRYIGD